MLVDRCQKIARFDASIDRIFASNIRRSNHLTGWNTAPGKDHGIRSRPMITSGLNNARRGTGHTAAAAGHVTDSRSTAEFSRDNNQNSPIQTTCVNILNQRGNSLIKERRTELVRIEHMMVHRMIVPVGNSTTKRTIKLGGDDLHASLNESPSHQALLAPGIHAISLTNLHRFLLQIKRGTSLRTCEQTQSLSFEAADGV
jgi:hypothetical protein